MCVTDLQKLLLMHVGRWKGHGPVASVMGAGYGSSLSGGENSFKSEETGLACAFAAVKQASP